MIYHINMATIQLQWPSYGLYIQIKYLTSWNGYTNNFMWNVTDYLDTIYTVMDLGGL